MADSGEQQLPDSSFLEKKVKRRDLVDWVVRGGLLTAFVGMVAPALVYLWPVTKRGPSSKTIDVGPEGEIPVWGSKKLDLNGNPALLLRTPNEYKAFSAVCTHLGCLVSWDAARRKIACPCHAGLFDLNGQVVAGPPPRPLPSYNVEVTGGKIFIHL